MVNASEAPRPKKILYVITKSNFGGAQRYVYELATAMNGLGHSVSIAAGGRGKLVDMLNEASIPVYKISGLARDISISGELRALHALYKIIRAVHPDIIHLNSSKVGVLGALMARICGVRRIIFTAHGWPFYEQRNLLWRTMAWFGSYLTTLLVHQVIEVSKHDHTARLPGAASKRTVIPTGVPDFPRLPRGEAQNYFKDKFSLNVGADTLWIASNSEYNDNKNLVAAIEAFSIYKKTAPGQFVYLLIGEGEKRAELEKLIGEYDLGDQCVLTGYTDTARQYLEAFDVFLMPSKKEGMPYALLEAGIASRAIIASKVGGIPEVITDGTNGLLINPDDVQSIATALAKVSDKNIRTQLACTIRKSITDGYSLRAMIEKTAALYEAKSSRD